MIREDLTEIKFVYCNSWISEIYLRMSYTVLERATYPLPPVAFGKGERMSKKNVIVSNVSEGHDNPIAELVQVACQFDSDIMLESDNRRINAKSIMGIMAFNPSDGMSVDIVTEGADEEAALDAIEKFLVCE